MPQLSPMLGFLMSGGALFALVLLMISLKRSSPKVASSKLNESSKSSFRFF